MMKIEVVTVTHVAHGAVLGIRKSGPSIQSLDIALTPNQIRDLVIRLLGGTS